MNLKNNTNALKDKSNYDLNRAWLLFKLISNPFISKVLTSLLQLALNLKLPIKFLVKATIFKQFLEEKQLKKVKKL